MSMMMMKNPNRDIGSVIIEQLSKPDGQDADDAQPVENPDRDSSVGLQAAGEKMMTAFHAKDTRSLVGAIRDMFDMLRFENHSEE